MADIKKIATRESYGNALKELGATAENLVVLDADLAGATKTSIFQKEYPERHFDCGIAEANMINIAAGLSTMGLVPFASTFAMFAAGRAYEQVRNTVGYPHLNVKIGATHGGISVGEDGASHQCCEDFALMRTIPGMTVMCPSDDVEAKAMVKAAYEMDGPVYMRFGRAATPVFHDENYHFAIGKGEVLSEGSDIAIIATGIMVPEAIEAAKALSEEGISVFLINMPTIKPLDEALVLEAAKKCGRILTVEEHSIIGGLGEAVSSYLSETLPTPVKRIGVNDEFGHSGPAGALLKAFGLCAENITIQAKKMLGK
jgi:transketolase